MRTCDAPQRTFEWFAARAGRITASRMCDVMAVPKVNKDGKNRGGVEELAARRNYRMELVCERITGQPSEHFVSDAMKRGNEKEPFARTAYELATDQEADLAGFIFHPVHDFTGASPDSLIGKDGGLEIKCFTTANHIACLEAGVVPEKHRDQMQWNIACAEREWWDFCSFDDRIPTPKLRIFIARLYRDDKRIAEMEREALKMHAEIDYKIMEFGGESQLPPIEAFMTQTADWKPVSVPERWDDYIDEVASELGGLEGIVP